MDDKTWLIIGLGVFATVATGGWSLAAYCFRLVMRGDLVPRSTHQDTLDALNVKDEAILTRLDHIEVLDEEQGKTLHAFIAAIQRVFRAPPLTEGDDT